MTAGAPGVRFVDLQAQLESLQPDINDAIDAVIADAAFILGPDVARFEEEFAAYCGVPYAVGLDTGLSALELSLRSLGLAPGDEVITQANTFVATLSAIHEAGGRPVLVDCDQAGGIDVDALAAAFSQRTRAVMPVHMYGRIGEIDEVVRLAHDRGAAVIEDACQAHGAVLDGRRAGSFGDAAAFSFYPGKNLGALGDGGVMVTADAGTADWVRRVRHYGQEAKHDHRLPPLNRRLDTLQAAVLRVKLRRLDDWNRRREWVADAYRERLAELPLELPAEEVAGRHIYHLFVVQTDQRDRLQAALTAEAIETGIHYPTPVHRLAVYQGLGYADGAFPRAEARARRMLSLPMYPELPLSGIERVTEAVAAFFAG